MGWVRADYRKIFGHIRLIRTYAVSYYMASSVSRQDESDPALCLATRAGKMELSCPLGTTRRFPQEKFIRKPHNKSFIDQACSVKMAGCCSRSFFASLRRKQRGGVVRAPDLKSVRPGFKSRSDR